MENKKSIKKVIAKCIGITLSVITALLMVFAVYATISYTKNKMVKFFGYSFHVVVTESMAETINPGDLVIAKAIKENDVKVNDIVVFRCEDTHSPIYGEYVIHRVIEIDEDGKIWTKGDNALTNPGKDTLPSHPIAIAVKINHGAGNFMSFFSSNKSIVILMVIACSVMLVFIEFGKVIAGTKQLKDEKSTLQKEELENKLKEEIKAELEKEIAENNKNE